MQQFKKIIFSEKNPTKQQIPHSCFLLCITVPYKWLYDHRLGGGTIPSVCLGQWFAKGHRKNLPTNWKTFQNQFCRKFAGPDSQDLITKHMPKFCEQPDLAGILKCKYSRHQIAHKVVVQKTSLRGTVGFLSGNGSQTEHH